jgi:aminopeptidase N
MRRGFWLAGSMLAACACAQVAHAANVPTQLPQEARPLHYSIEIIPNAQALTFQGRATIDVNVLRPTRSITLNAADLDITSAGLEGGADAQVRLDAKKQTVTLAFPAALKAGPARLRFTYSGKINEQANGLFALDYKDVDGKPARALFTQFEAPDARRFAPTWDEPNYKATFDLSAVIPTRQLAVSNMPVAARTDRGDGTSLVRFTRTPLMSTYLLFFALGDLERISMQSAGVDIGVVASHGNVEKARYALEAAAKIVPYYNDYFGVPYPLPKLDNVAGPGQSQFFGAMENWGAIFTFESILLIDPRITTPRQKQGIFVTAAHEIAHQWFGNLVTMKWWDDLWLNEGFASWMENKATTHFNPEWQAGLDAVAGRETMMGLDALETTHPVVQRIKTVDEVNQAFDQITYQKGQAVIAMLEGFTGETVWRNGLRRYMKRHAYANTTTEDLWAAVEAAGGKNVRRIANDFTKQPGIPLVRVEDVRCEVGRTVARLTQGEFSADRKSKTDASALRWTVPVVAQTLDSAPVRTTVQGRATVQADGCGPLLVNAGQSGYFRTLYAPAQLAALTAAFAKLPAKDQYGLVTDAVALATADYQPMSAALDLLVAAPAEASPRLLYGLLPIWGDLHGRFNADAAAQAAIAKRVSVQFGPALERLGFVAKANEPMLDSLLRTRLIGTLGAMGDGRVLAEADRLAGLLATDPNALNGPLRQTWLRIMAVNADSARWAQLRTMAQAADSALVKSTLYQLLGAAKDPKLAQAALDLALTDEPGKTTSAALIAQVSVAHPDLAVDFVLANLDKVSRFVDASARNEFIARLAAESRNPAMAAKLAAFADKTMSAEARGAVDQTINALKVRQASEPRILQQTKAWLGGESLSR